MKRSTLKLFPPEIGVKTGCCLPLGKILFKLRHILYVLKEYLKNNWNFYIERDIALGNTFE